MTTIPIYPEQVSISPLLTEVQHALHKLVQHNESTCIDLNSLPFSAHEEQVLRHQLGQGEVKAELNSLGKSCIWETQISGVWWVEHFNLDNQKTHQYLEITWIPDLLKSQPQDVQESLQQLSQKYL